MRLRLCLSVFALHVGLPFLAWGADDTAPGMGVPLSPSPPRAVSAVESDFREVFASAGWSALFGASVGLALLPFLPTAPQENVRFVAGGASLGFAAGSALAFWKIQNRSLWFQPLPPPSALDGGWGLWHAGALCGGQLNVCVSGVFR